MEVIVQTHSYDADHLRKLFELFYGEEDEKWHSDHHENRGSCAENIEDSLATVSTDAKICVIKEQGEPAAFFTWYEDDHGNVAIEAFHVRVKFRRRDFLINFWSSVKRVIGKDFWVAAYEINTPAVHHLQRQGFDLVKIDNHREFRIFVFKVKATPCQSPPQSH